MLYKYKTSLLFFINKWYLFISFIIEQSQFFHLNHFSNLSQYRPIWWELWHEAKTPLTDREIINQFNVKIPPSQPLRNPAGLSQSCFPLIKSSESHSEPTLLGSHKGNGWSFHSHYPAPRQEKLRLGSPPLFPGQPIWHNGKAFACNTGNLGSLPRWGRREWPLTPVFSPAEFEKSVGSQGATIASLPTSSHLPCQPWHDHCVHSLQSCGP